MSSNITGIQKHLKVTVCEDATDALRHGFLYRPPVHLPIGIDQVVISKNGTQTGRATVDLVMQDALGQKYVCMLTVALLESALSGSKLTGQVTLPVSTVEQLIADTLEVNREIGKGGVAYDISNRTYPATQRILAALRTAIGAAVDVKAKDYTMGDWFKDLDNPHAGR